MKTKIDPKYMQPVLDYSDQITQYDQVLTKVAHVIASDHDGKVKKALVDLGWTPPADTK